MYRQKFEYDLMQDEDKMSCIESIILTDGPKKTTIIIS